MSHVFVSLALSPSHNLFQQVLGHFTSRRNPHKSLRRDRVKYLIDSEGKSCNPSGFDGNNRPWGVGENVKASPLDSIAVHLIPGALWRKMIRLIRNRAQPEINSSRDIKNFLKLSSLTQSATLVIL